MDCELIQPDLAAYHFGEIDASGRSAIEAHLGACPRCLRDYFALKRSLETFEARPSPEAKERLRRAVASATQHAPSSWRWWERPLAVALACAAVLLSAAATGALANSPGGPPHGWLVASARR